VSNPKSFELEMGFLSSVGFLLNDMPQS